LKKEAKLWLFGIGVSISVTLYSEKFLVLFFKKEPFAFWAGTETTPIPQESGSRPVGIIGGGNCCLARCGADGVETAAVS
jgi:hypothetical protein